MSNQERGMLSKDNFNFLIGYLIFLMIDGVVLCIVAMLHQVYFSTFSIGLMSILGTIGAALVGSSMYYTRKLYRTAMAIGHGLPTELFERLREMGYYFFYLLRPLYAVVFSLLALVIIKFILGVITDSHISTRLVYLMIIAGFMIGYYSNIILNLFEKSSPEEAYNLPQGNQQ